MQTVNMEILRRSAKILKPMVISKQERRNKVKAIKKIMLMGVVTMMLVSFVMGTQAFAWPYPTPTSITASKHPFSSARFLSLYNNTGDTVYDITIHKLLYVDSRGFLHWEQIGEIDEIAFLSTATVIVPADAGLLVRYCLGEDDCSMYDMESTGSFGPLTSIRTTVTLY